MTVLRGEISDPFVTKKPFDPSAMLAMKSFCTVTVEVEVLADTAKSCLDLLLNTANDFGNDSSGRPF